jgi:hypothetical protein
MGSIFSTMTIKDLIIEVKKICALDKYPFFHNWSAQDQFVYQGSFLKGKARVLCIEGTLVGICFEKVS